MKVILLEDVYKQGVAGEIVDVAPGYARNYLIPRRMAVKATPGTIKQFENLSKKARIRRSEREEKFSRIAEQIEALTLYFGVKAGETGKLYGSVTPTEIAEALNENLGLDIDRRRIGDRPLRELGAMQVPVRLDSGLTPTVRVVIHREGQDPREAEAALAAEEAEAAAEVEAEAAAEAAFEAELEAAADETAPEAAEAEAAAEPEAEEEVESGEEEAPAE